MKLIVGLKSIPYRIAKWFFRIYIDKLVEEHIGEIAKRDWLVSEIVDANLDRLAEFIEDLFMRIILGWVEAENDEEAIKKSEDIIKLYINSVNEIEDLRERFSEIKLKYGMISVALALVPLIICLVGFHSIN